MQLSVRRSRRIRTNNVTSLRSIHRVKPIPCTFNPAGLDKGGGPPRSVAQALRVQGQKGTSSVCRGSKCRVPGRSERFRASVSGFQVDSKGLLMVLHFQSQRILGCWVYLHDFSKNDVNKQQRLTLMTSARLISTDSSMSNMTWQRGEHGFVQTVRPQILSSPLLDQPQRVARFQWQTLPLWRPLRRGRFAFAEISELQGTAEFITHLINVIGPKCYRISAATVVTATWQASTKGTSGMWIRGLTNHSAEA